MVEGYGSTFGAGYEGGYGYSGRGDVRYDMLQRLNVG